MGSPRSMRGVPKSITGSGTGGPRVLPGANACHSCVPRTVPAVSDQIAAVRDPGVPLGSPEWPGASSTTLRSGPSMDGKSPCDCLVCVPRTNDSSDCLGGVGRRYRRGRGRIGPPDAQTMRRGAHRGADEPRNGRCFVDACAGPHMGPPNPHEVRRGASWSTAAVLVISRRKSPKPARGERGRAQPRRIWGLALR